MHVPVIFCGECSDHVHEVHKIGCKITISLSLSKLKAASSDDYFWRAGGLTFGHSNFDRVGFLLKILICFFLLMIHCSVFYNLKETSKSNESLSIMAVDNLPSELPRDSSHEFSEGIINEVMPYLLKDDDGRILNATISSDGSFLKKYNYLSNYINIYE